MSTVIAGTLHTYGQHTTHVEHDPYARYPYRAVCSCGWHSWGYVAEHAAQGMADDHVNPRPYVHIVNVATPIEGE